MAATQAQLRCTSQYVTPAARRFAHSFSAIERLSAPTRTRAQGLRHTAATRLRELGFDLRTIADFLGQKTEGMAGHYAKRADLTKKLASVAAVIDADPRNAK
jgi:integrase